MIKLYWHEYCQALFLDLDDGRWRVLIDIIPYPILEGSEDLNKAYIREEMYMMSLTVIAKQV
jgi:hypothetical protein